ncbi:MAG: hypothetical protein AB1656_17570 [Candidatus Omnitrophota bacterium]
MRNRQRHIFKSFLLGSLVLLAPRALDAKTITIPGDADSIQEAVDLAVSGDEIVCVSETVNTSYKKNPKYEGFYLVNVTIKDKNIKIRGSKEVERTRITFGPDVLVTAEDMINIENAQVILENLYLESPPMTRLGGLGPIAGPITLVSGSLTLNNCQFVNNFDIRGSFFLHDSSILGYSFMNSSSYSRCTILTPSLIIHSASNIQVEISNSTISSDSDTAFVNMIVSGVSDSSFIFTNSAFIGGDSNCEIIPGIFSGSGCDGSDGIKFENCQNIELKIASGLFQGGPGNPFGSSRSGNVINKPGKGGSGILFANSSGQIMDSQIGTKAVFIGGNGADGGLLPLSSIGSGPDILFNGTAGGNGLSFVNSYFRHSLNWFIAKGGYGGRGTATTNSYKTPGPNGPEIVIANPGAPGLPISLDENSTFQFLTDIAQWPIY